MEEPIQVNLLIQTEVNINSHLFEFKTLPNYTDFKEKIQSLDINHKVAYEFFDNVGEKVVLTGENYKEFLCSSDGYKNYIFGKLFPGEEIFNPDPIHEIRTKNWRCTFCSYSSNKPTINLCSICGTCNYCKVPKIKDKYCKCASRKLCEFCNACGECKGEIVRPRF